MSDQIAQIGHGMALEFGNQPTVATSTVFTRITGVFDLNPAASTGDAVDATDADSPGAWKEKIPGLKDAGDIAVEIEYEKSQHAELFDNLFMIKRGWRATLPDGSKMEFNGFINELPVASPLDDRITTSFSIAVSGVPVFLES